MINRDAQEELIRKLFERRNVELFEGIRNERSAIAERRAAAGTLNGGGFVSDVTSAYRAGFEAFARGLTKDVFDLVHQSGTAIDDAVALWIKSQLEPRFETAAKNMRAEAAQGRVLPDELRQGVDLAMEKSLAKMKRDLGIELDRALLTRQPAGDLNSKSTISGIRLFISHSTDDVKLAAALIDLFRAALTLPASAIRCTSIDGYRLPGGADTKEQLRREVHQTDAFIGIVSTTSLRSIYVLFELGARWGVGKPLVPVLAPGIDVADVGEPLKSLNALRADRAGQLYQLVTDIGQELGIDPEKPAVYQKHIEHILQLAQGSDGNPGPPTASDATSMTLQRQDVSLDDRSLLSSLSGDARELLTNAAKDPQATVLITEAFGGAQVQTNGREFVEPNSPRSESRWRRAVTDLLHADLLNDVHGRGQVLQMTDEGFRVADLLEGT